MAVKNAETKGQPTASLQKAQDAGIGKKFAVEKLRRNSIKLFGVTQSTFDGAMYGHEGKEYTINEVKGFIDVWMNGRGGKH